MKVILILLSFLLIKQNCLAEEAAINAQSLIDKLIDKGTTKWVFDSKRNSGHLGNDPAESCLKVYEFTSKDNVIESCLNISGTEKTNKLTLLSGNIVKIGDKKYDLMMSKDGCLISLLGIDDSTKTNLVLKKENSSSTECKG